jgi:5-(carboxyamino)imidazole ribonucleotide synthase
MLATSAAEARQACERLGARDLIAESRVVFDRELSIIAVRGQNGEVATYTPAQNHHRNGILVWSLAPAPTLDAHLRVRAEAIARRIVDALDYVGVMTAELFQVGDRLLVNELAPRVHNSGHWTIEGADTSQFENHLRAVLGLPLGSTGTEGGWVLLNLLGEPPDLRRALALPGAHLHLYDKAPRPGRKIGHVTCRATDPVGDLPRLRDALGLA